MKQNFTVRQGAFDGVEPFSSVAQRRSFRKAVAEFRVTPWTISQRYAHLKRASARRSPSAQHAGVGLTEAGE